MTVSELYNILTNILRGDTKLTDIFIGDVSIESVILVTKYCGDGRGQYVEFKLKEKN